MYYTMYMHVYKQMYVQTHRQLNFSECMCWISNISSLLYQFKVVNLLPYLNVVVLMIIQIDITCLVDMVTAHAIFIARSLIQIQFRMKLLKLLLILSFSMSYYQ